jgi:hypothetical protein
MWKNLRERGLWIENWGLVQDFCVKNDILLNTINRKRTIWGIDYWGLTIIYKCYIFNIFYVYIIQFFCFFFWRKISISQDIRYRLVSNIIPKNNISSKKYKIWPKFMIITKLHRFVFMYQNSNSNLIKLKFFPKYLYTRLQKN